MAAAKATKGRSDIAADEVPELVAAARDAMMARGKGQLGDKTVLDGLDAIASALKGVDGGGMRRQAVEAVEATLQAFKGRPCKLGRARMFAEKSAMLDDPGQLALLHIVRGLS